MDSAYVALIAAAIGAAAALGGTTVTLLVQGRRERKTWRRDQRARSAVQFLREARSAHTIIELHNRVRPADLSLPDPGWRTGVMTALAEVEVFGSARLASAATEVCQALVAFERMDATENAAADLHASFAGLRSEMQQDLGVALTELSTQPVELVID